MKVYKNRNELRDDIIFIKKNLIDKERKTHLINLLFNQWMDTSPDSPWYSSKLEENAVKSLIKISEKGISNEWQGEHIFFKDPQIL
tara:strand:- start:750 stop:1007 length:258 start_codon:yes stop_codon:yes gene_type:complete